YMRFVNRLFLALFLFIASLFAERSIPYVVSAQWLSEHMKDKDLVILQTGFSRNEFKYAHLPNARFLWLNSLAPATPDLNTEMPSIQEAAATLEELGVSQNSKIVLVFAGQNVSTTTRMFLALSYFGFGEQVALLDGGLEHWKREGREVSKEIPVVLRTKLTLTPNESVTTDAEWVKNHLTDTTVTVVDARTKNFYEGNGGGIARLGHIKGAKNIVFNSILDSTNRIKSAAELQQLFDSAGVVKGSTIVSYCHVGQQATVVYFAAKILGYNAKVYDGSFEDWNMRDESFPVEKTRDMSR
ncbi:MAG: rhodanese-like domain-containing protein, partial [Bacteroidetes bacterium]|nr:rhodanese-like domain-containing protein [Bacteroidota bacterium]